MATLTDKYVHAVTRTLPEDQRADVADELRATIADRVDSLLAAGETPDQQTAEYAAIVELDDPYRLASGYTGRPLHLIGPAVFPAYVRLLRTLAATVLPVVAIVLVIVGVFEDRTAGALIGDAVWTTFNVAIQLAFWVTLVWVLVERNLAPAEVAKSLGANWTPDDLPDPPRATEFPIGETVGAVLMLLASTAFLIGQHFWSWHKDGAESLPILDPDLWSMWLPVVVAALVAMLVLEFAKHRVGHWTVPLAVTNTVLGVAFAAPLIWAASTDQLLNPEFVAQFHDTLEAGPINTTVIIALALITLWDIGDCWRKVRTPAMLGS